jgi:uracil-DNA glycosylase
MPDRPEIVVLMGETARTAPRLEGIKYVETYHPAAAMRFPKIKKKFIEEMRTVFRIVQ